MSDPGARSARVTSRVIGIARRAGAPARPLVIGEPKEASQHGRSSVTVEADGVPIWFDSRDAALEPSVEAGASALLLPAARCGRRLSIVPPVSAAWHANVSRLLEVWQEWWAYPVLVPHAPLRVEAGTPAAGVALCFTGGLDSFFSLLRGRRRPDMLVFVEGFDIPLGDDVRLTAWSAAMARVAAATGARQVQLRSNLRTHPLVARSQWDRAHGGALAAAGHLLAGEVGTLVMASSAPTRYGYAWGSHERTDPLWSSDRLHVVHDGAGASRVEKLRALAGEPLVHEHLRVCWENRAPAGNCSACDKCVSTMAIAAACAEPDRFITFDWSIPVEARIARLRTTRFVMTYGDLLALPLPAALRSAIEALLRRNRLPHRLRTFWHRWRG